MEITSKEKILKASMELFASKGYKKTTTKLIAKEAGVNEVTVFRLFGKKSVIVEEIIAFKMSNISPLERDFNEKVTYDLAEDLFNASMAFYQPMHKNLPLMMALLDELGDNFAKVFSKLPGRVIDLYEDYFRRAYDKGIILEEDAEFLAKSFTTFVIGVAMTKVMTHEMIIGEDVTSFIKRSADIFAIGLKK